MKHILVIILSAGLMAIFNGCSTDDNVASDKADIYQLLLEVEGEAYSTTITGNDIVPDRNLPYGTEKVKVNSLTLSPGATCSIAKGVVIPVTDEGTDITVIAEDTVNSRVYHLSFPLEAASGQAVLMEMVVSYNEKQYPVSFEGNNLSVDREFAYNATGMITIVSFKISEFAVSNIFAGQQFSVDSGFTVKITAQDSITQGIYVFNIIRDTDGALLTGNPDYTSCEKYNTYRFDELMMENNMWNADNLPPGSFSQCIYHYKEGITSLFGWQWSYADNQHGVNAYPEVIYGVKPWYADQGSTTIHIPVRIGDITTCKVDYELECYVDDGEYNLAFDNWICQTSNITPENIRFEFMIWEDYQDLTAFGDLRGQVTTSNGTYNLYKGEPDWEPAGCNWTYLAFVRTSKRQSGMVDVDEMMQYLIVQNILSPDHYLASLELGNEVGNSSGYTVFKKFEVVVE